MNVDFEARAGHAERIRDSGLIVDGEFLRNDVNDLALRRQRDGTRRFDDALDVFAVDFTRRGSRWA